MRTFILSCLTLLILGLGVSLPAQTLVSLDQLFPFRYSHAVTYGNNTLATSTIYFRYGTPVGFIRKTVSAMLPPGLTNMTPDERQNALVVEGTPEAIEAMRKMVKAFDVPIPQIIIAAHVWRFAFAPDGTWEMREEASPIITTLNDMRCNFAFTTDDMKKKTQLQTAYTFVPHLNPDGTITCDGAVVRTELAVKRDNAAALSFRRTLTPGKQATFGYAFHTDPAVQKMVSDGHFPTHLKAPVSVYYLKFSASLGPQR